MGSEDITGEAGVPAQQWRDVLGGEGKSEDTQWVLQPRGGASRRGPAHFRHSVRNGVELGKYEDFLGEQQARLHGLARDGRVRFWGSTPTDQKRNAKAVALRERKVGDEVLFYADKKFIAKARILALFRNSELAKEIWGADEETGSTWEHMMALGDVVEFELPAVPILSALTLPVPLRSLTLVPAEERRRALESGPARGEGPAAGRPRPQPPAARPPQKPTLGRAGLRRALETLTAQQGTREWQESLAVLCALGRLHAGQDRLVPWGILREEISRLVSDFGGARSAAAVPTLQQLRDSDLWEVEGVPAPDSRETAVRTGLSKDVTRLLRQPLTRADAIGLLRKAFSGSQVSLLERVGLEAFGTAGGMGELPADGTDRPGRREVRSSRLERDPNLAAQVKLFHGHRCQVCGIALRILHSHYSEAAHIRGLGDPHQGPDTAANMLCLCPNHHVQFDRLALYIDDAWMVRNSEDHSLHRPLRREPGHEIGEEYVRYHRALCGVAT